MGKIDILGTMTKKSRPVSGGAGWHQESERHSRAKKLGHAGGKYASDGEGGASKAVKSSNSGCSGNHSKSTFNKFCDVCGRTL